MAAIRHLLTIRRAWLGLVFMLALAVRLLVPAGFMPSQVGGVPIITICDGTGTQIVTAMADMPGMHDANGKRGDHGKQPIGSCPFAIAALSAIGTVDAITLPAPTIASFIIRHVLAQPSPRLRTARLRPPAQGPPTV